MAKDVYRSFGNAIAPAELVNSVANALREAAKGIRRKKDPVVISCMKRYAQTDLLFGNLFVISPAVCDTTESLPYALVTSSLGAKLPADIAAAFKDSVIASDSANHGLTDEQLNIVRKTLFTDAEGKEHPLIVFAPAWSSKYSYRSFLFTDGEELENFVKREVFCVTENPALSSMFDRILSEEHGDYLTQLVPGIPDNNVPVDVFTAAKTASAGRKMIRITAANIEELDKVVLTDEELDVVNSLGSATTKAIKRNATAVEPIQAHVLLAKLNETGLRDRPDYGEKGSKESIDPTKLAGSDKKADFNIMIPGQIIEEMNPDLDQRLRQYPGGTDINRDKVNPFGATKKPAMDPNEALGDAPSYPAQQGLSGSPSTQLAGPPLRSEMNLRGPGFFNDFYSVQCTPLTLAASYVKKASESNNVVDQITALFQYIVYDRALDALREIRSTAQTGMQLAVPFTSKVNIANAVVGAFYSTSEALSVMLNQVPEAQWTGILEKSYAQAAAWRDGEGGQICEVLAEAVGINVPEALLEIKITPRVKQ